MRIIAISDTHGSLPYVPECDMFIHAGDICPATNHTRVFQSNWLATKFYTWFNEIEAKHKIIVAGNHDWIFYDSKKMLPEFFNDPTKCHYLENTGVEIDGIKFWGSPWTPFFNDWAFNFPEGPAGDVLKQNTWNEIPLGTDAVITHGPPNGYLDVVRDDTPAGHWQRNAGYAAYRRVGCPFLLDRIMIVKPKVHIFGHVHTTPQEKYGETTFYNASVLDEQYRLVGKPTEILI